MQSSFLKNHNTLYICFDEKVKSLTQYTKNFSATVKIGMESGRHVTINVPYMTVGWTSHLKK